jgi:hypothetical protein
VTDTALAHTNPRGEISTQNERLAPVRAALEREKVRPATQSLNDAAANSGTSTDDLHARQDTGDKRRLEILQRWRGIVTSITRDEFTATIFDLDAPHASPEEVVMSIRDVARPDIELLQVGAVFYWHLGRQLNRHGSIRRFMELRFRRLPVTTDVEPSAPFASLFLP